MLRCPGIWLPVADTSSNFSPAVAHISSEERGVDSERPFPALKFEETADFRGGKRNQQEIDRSPAGKRFENFFSIQFILFLNIQQTREASLLTELEHFFTVVFKVIQ